MFKTSSACYQLFDSISFMLRQFNTVAQVSQSASSTLLFRIERITCRSGSVNKLIGGVFVMQCDLYPDIFQRVRI